MLNCDACQKLMADAIYLEDGKSLPQEVSDHLHDCEMCRVDYEELIDAKHQLHAAGLQRETFDDIPERASLDDLYARVLPELDKIDAQRFREIANKNSARRHMAIGALAASLVIFLTGFVFLSSNPLETPNSIATTEVNPDLMNYLNREQVMLMQVANTESGNESVLPIQRTVARDMAFEANVLTGVDNSPFASGERKLLKDIEFMLLQIANLDETNMEDGVALLQRFLEENGVLFKIRLLEMRDNDLVI